MRRIRLTENQLHRIIKESVGVILRENGFNEYWHDFNDNGLDDFSYDGLDDYDDDDDLSSYTNDDIIKDLRNVSPERFREAFLGFKDDRYLYKLAPLYIEFSRNEEKFGYEQALDMFLSKYAEHPVIYQLYREIYG